MEIENVKNHIITDTKFGFEWNGINFYIENVDGNINVLFENDIHIGINGELGVVSTNNIHLDTIGSKVFINSRKSKQLKDLPESIEHKEKLEMESKKRLLHMHEEHESFQKMIDDLKEKVNQLENEIKDIL